MALPRRQALKLLHGRVPEVEHHLARLGDEPRHSSTRKWKSEIRNWLREMEEVLPHVGKKKQPRNGRPVSTPTESPWKLKDTASGPELQRLLRTAYNTYQKLDDSAANLEARRDFVFHMTDWIDDLERLAALYRNPESFDKDQAASAVFGFLIHALPHLNAAGRLLLGKVPDPFINEEIEP